MRSMTSKQRAYLRGLANTMDPIIHVGKDGVNANMIRQLTPWKPGSLSRAPSCKTAR